MLYLYPTTISDDVLDAMADSEKVCKYIDLPLQHASDAVLKRMKRPGTRAQYERLLDSNQAAAARRRAADHLHRGISRRDRRRDFDELKAFVESMQFDHVGVFTYSHEEGTSAYALTDDVPAADKRGAVPG